MIRTLPFLLLLAACGVNDPLPPAANPTEAACRAEARTAPDVKTTYQRMPPPENATARQRVEAEADAAERAAYLRCMRARGMAPRGGVEPVRPI